MYVSFTITIKPQVNVKHQETQIYSRHAHSQSQLLEGLDRVEGRIWILLKDFYLICCVDKIISYQLVQQGLGRFVVWKKQIILQKLCC